MFEYGERMYGRGYRYTGFSSQASFRYRYDPVPYTGINAYRWGCWYKKFRVYKYERSLYNDHKEFVRSKRNPRNLPDPWDDIQRGDVGTRRSWKKKKIRKQYMKNLPL